MKPSYVIGVDYGTDSVRSVVVDAGNGVETASSVFYYPRWKAGLYCNPSANQFRQHLLDYMEGLEATIKDCIRQAGAVRASPAVPRQDGEVGSARPVRVAARRPLGDLQRCGGEAR